MGYQVKSFTLMELMIVIVIVGILAAMVMPMFPRVMESTKAKEAVAGLQQIRTGERIYRVEENTYFYSTAAAGLPETVELNDKIRTFLDVRDNDKRNWDYDVTFVGTEGSTFVATATRLGGGETYKDKTIIIDQDGTVEPGATDPWPLPLPAD